MIIRFNVLAVVLVHCEICCRHSVNTAHKQSYLLNTFKIKLETLRVETSFRHYSYEQMMGTMCRKHFACL